MMGSMTGRRASIDIDGGGGIEYRIWYLCGGGDKSVRRRTRSVVVSDDER